MQGLLLQLCLVCTCLVQMAGVLQVKEVDVLRGSPVDHCLAMQSSMSANDMSCSRPMLSRAPPSPKNEYGLVGALQNGKLVILSHVLIFLVLAAPQGINNKAMQLWTSE